MPSILFLAQRIPYPPTKGEKIRSLQILRHLRRSYDIYLGCLVDDPRDLEHVPTVRAMCADAYFATLDRRRAKAACLRGLLTGEALSVAFYHNRGLRSWVRQVLRDHKPEVIFVCSSNMAPYVLGLRGNAPVFIVDMGDVDSEKWRLYSHRGSLLMRWIYKRECWRVAQLELRIVGECDWVTFVSAEEATLFTRLQPGQSGKVRVISNGVDHVFFDPTHCFNAPFSLNITNFVFTGTMNYPPNIDAVIWFSQTVLPIIRRSIPDAQFHIVGANPTAAVRALTAIEGVFVTGWVPDVRPYLAFATACVAPLRIARGIQNKVLEAMAMAKTVVVTRNALEGIGAVPGAEVLLSDAASEFAAACVHATNGDSAAVGKEARRRIMRDYVWAECLSGFDPLLSVTAEQSGN